jgi:mRNA interferase MazF
MKRPVRGQVFMVRAGGAATHAVVVSNDLRNEALPTVLVARITTVPKPAVPTIVELPVGEPVVGRVLCDSIAEVPSEAVGRPAGHLSRKAMRRVDVGLRAALGVDRG